MKSFQDYFDVFPRIVPADQESEIRITPRVPHAELPELDKITIRCLPVSGQFAPEDGKQAEEAGRAIRSAELRDGSLILRIFFAGEQEHSLILDLRDLPARRASSAWVARDMNAIRFNLYSLYPDLMKLRPYKGDIHLHSLCSDGMEAPEYVAARYREEGFDFIAVTDHGKYAPSLHTMKFWKDLRNGFRLFPGEEVHTPDNPVHIINFGGTFSVNDLAQNEPERYRREVEEISRSLPPELIPDGETPCSVTPTGSRTAM